MKFAVYIGIFVIIFMLSCGNCNHTSSKPNTEVCLKVPFSVDECYAESLKHPISPKSAKTDCLLRLMWFYEPDQKLTEADLTYFSMLSKYNVVNGIPQPQSGFRVRKEYRQLTDIERQKLHNAFQKLYEKGVLQKYALLHKEAINTTYGGAALLGWNRVFLARLEEELRHEDGNISLAYWDPTLDGNMGNAANSILFSNNLFGNSNGDVVTGPFANWRTARGKLWREYASNQRGKLISDADIRKIVTRCNTDDIVFPVGSQEKKEFVIEYHMNGGHNWIGGDMSDREYAAFDPIFYMYRAFIDMLWEEVRLYQKSTCKINPETAYAKITGGHGHEPNDLMYGFNGFKNIDGLKNYWTDAWYKYERRPHCPNCGSKNLYCDNLQGVCVSRSRPNDYKPFQSTLSGRFGLNLEPFEPEVSIVPKRIVSKFEPSPLNDCRTRASAKLDAKTAAALKKSFASSAFEVFYPVQNHAVPEQNKLPLVETIVHLNSGNDTGNTKQPVNNPLPTKQSGTVKTTYFAAVPQPHTEPQPHTISQTKSQPRTIANQQDTMHKKSQPNTIPQPPQQNTIHAQSQPHTIPQPPQQDRTHIKSQPHTQFQTPQQNTMLTKSEPNTIPQPPQAYPMHTKPQLLKNSQPDTVPQASHHSTTYTKSPPLTIFQQSLPHLMHTKSQPNIIPQPPQQDTMYTKSQQHTIPQPPQPHTIRTKPQLLTKSQPRAISQPPEPHKIHTKPQLLTKSQASAISQPPQQHTIIQPLQQDIMHIPSQPETIPQPPKPHTMHIKPQLLTKSQPHTIPQPPQYNTIHTNPKPQSKSEPQTRPQVPTASEPFTITKLKHTVPQPHTKSQPNTIPQLHTKDKEHQPHTKSQPHTQTQLHTKHTKPHPNTNSQPYTKPQPRTKQTNPQPHTKAQPFMKPERHTDPQLQRGSHPNTKTINQNQQELGTRTYSKTVAHAQKFPPLNRYVVQRRKYLRFN